MVIAGLGKFLFINQNSNSGKGYSVYKLALENRMRERGES